MNVKKEDFYTMMLFVFSVLLLAGMVYDAMQIAPVENVACKDHNCIKTPVAFDKEGVIKEIKKDSGVIEWPSA